MANGYKKYMKKNVTKDYALWKLFAVSFFGMLLVFTFLIKSFSPKVDTSIGDYKQDSDIESMNEVKENVDNRLAMIQEEDTSKNFSEIMKNAAAQQAEQTSVDNDTLTRQDTAQQETTSQSAQESVYKVFIGTYSSAEQARVAKDIITDTGINLTPIVKCIGSNNYTLQVGIFKNKSSADALLYTIQQNHLPGRIVQDY
jgi:cell division protein FtsN